MKHYCWFLPMLMFFVLLGTSGLKAEIIGLQVADTADLHESGQLELMPGTVFGNDVSFYGIRQTYNFLDGLRAFLDLGAVDLENESLDFGGSLGATVCIPSDFIADLAFRSTIYSVNTDGTDVIGGTMSLICSDETLLDDLHLYSALGVDFSQTKEIIPDNGGKTSTDIKPFLSLGLIYNITRSVGIYFEGTYVSSPFVGFGVKLR